MQVRIILIVLAIHQPWTLANLNVHPSNHLQWFEDLNNDMKMLNKRTAFYAWELSVGNNETMAQEAVKFTAIKNMWRNRRCDEGVKFESSFNATQQRMLYVLCRGPKFTEYQIEQLSMRLNLMQTIFTETQVCIPEGLDLCINFDHIWNFTYVKGPFGKIEKLHLASVAPEFNSISTQNGLHFFDGKISHDYYVFAGSDNQFNRKQTIKRITQSTPICFNGEPEMSDISSGNFAALKRPDCVLRFNKVFRWAWESWRMAVGNEIGQVYPEAVQLMNVAAQNSGYENIGETWREEIEIQNLPQVSRQLWYDVKPFYQLLHALLRNILRQQFKETEGVKRFGTIPAHLLGNMWSQNWAFYHEAMIPFSEPNIDDNLERTNWSTINIVKHADDFYRSLGLPKMTNKFWAKSRFLKSDNFTKCHGTAANMFDNDDFRMITCAGRTFEDLYEIVHEMGHIQYYMAYDKQPGLFQDGTNSALQESIGDAIYLGVMTPHHLNRIGLLPDKYLYPNLIPPFHPSYLKGIHATKKSESAKNMQMAKDILNEIIKNSNGSNDEAQMLREFANILNTRDINSAVDDETWQENNPHQKEANSERTNRPKSEMNSFDISLLMKMALSKIPQIPFQLIIDEFRWKIFDGDVSMQDSNSFFWNLVMREQGVHPPDWIDRRDFFDPGAKFHIADNTPYSRYFLASFIHIQIFKGLCEVTVFGKVNSGQKLPMPLHRCDIYGSRRAGTILKEALSLGASKNWSEVLHILTGSRFISAQPLLEYYQPLIEWIQAIVEDFEIPVGWN